MTRMTEGRPSLRRLTITFVALVAMGAAMRAPELRAASGPSVVAVINGGGTANMDDGEGRSLFGMTALLLSDGSASGHFECVDQMGDSFPGNAFGRVTSWSQDTAGEFTFSGVLKVVSFPPFLESFDNLEFTVTVQNFGGPGVGHWTLDIPFFGGVICWETLLTGQIVLR
jgi:hypothetical protein